MAKLQFLYMPGCHTCQEVEKMIKESILPEFTDLEFEKINMTSDKGQKLTEKYSILASPGIVINGELFGTGKISGKKLGEKLKSLQ